MENQNQNENTVELPKLYGMALHGNQYINPANVTTITFVPKGESTRHGVNPDRDKLVIEIANGTTSYLEFDSTDASKEFLKNYDLAAKEARGQAKNGPESRINGRG